MLKYVGDKDGHGWALPNIPARDLSDEEVATLGGAKALIETGLYEEVGAQDTQYPTPKPADASGAAQQ